MKIIYDQYTVYLAIQINVKCLMKIVGLSGCQLYRH